MLFCHVIVVCVNKKVQWQAIMGGLVSLPFNLGRNSSSRANGVGTRRVPGLYRYPPADGKNLSISFGQNYNKSSIQWTSTFLVIITLATRDLKRESQNCSYLGTCRISITLLLSLSRFGILLLSISYRRILLLDPLQFPYKQPPKSQPLRTLRSFINIQRDSIKLVK